MKSWSSARWRKERLLVSEAIVGLGFIDHDHVKDVATGFKEVGNVNLEDGEEKENE